MAIYRIYVDEVGNHDMKHTRTTNERFLSLFGVIVRDGEDGKQIEREMQDLKVQYFGHNPDEPLIFHRSDLSGMKGQFRPMRTWEQDKREELNESLLNAYNRWQYKAIIVALDKKAHLDKYNRWHYEPYFWCMQLLLERYIKFLQKNNSSGDVMFESRNRVLDDVLRRDFHGLRARGAMNISSAEWATRIPSSKLKLVSKSANVAGLQLADLLAHSAHYDVLRERGLASGQASSFGIKVSQILRDVKYDRNGDGKIEGCGMKFAP